VDGMEQPRGKPVWADKGI